MHLLKAKRDLFILPVSVVLFKFPVIDVFSLPAKSTKYNFPKETLLLIFIKLSPDFCSWISRYIWRIAWDLEENLFLSVCFSVLLLFPELINLKASFSLLTWTHSAPCKITPFVGSVLISGETFLSDNKSFNISL